MARASKFPRGTRRVPLCAEHTPCNLLNSAGDCQVPSALDALALRGLVRRRATTNQSPRREHGDRKKKFIA